MIALAGAADTCFLRVPEFQGAIDQFQGDQRKILRRVAEIGDRMALTSSAIIALTRQSSASCAWPDPTILAAPAQIHFSPLPLPPPVPARGAFRRRAVLHAGEPQGLDRHAERVVVFADDLVHFQTQLIHRGLVEIAFRAARRISEAPPPLRNHRADTRFPAQSRKRPKVNRNVSPTCLR